MEGYTSREIVLLMADDTWDRGTRRDVRPIGRAWPRHGHGCGADMVMRFALQGNDEIAAAYDGQCLDAVTAHTETFPELA